MARGFSFRPAARANKLWPMNKRALGKTGILLSEIGIGGWQLGGPLLLDGKADGHPDLGREFSIKLIR